MATFLAAALPYLLGSSGAAAATGGLSGLGGLANALGGGTFGSMAGSTLGGAMQGATQGSGLMGLLSGGSMGASSNPLNRLLQPGDPSMSFGEFKNKMMAPEPSLFHRPQQSGFVDGLAAPQKDNYSTFVNGLGRL